MFPNMYVTIGINNKQGDLTRESFYDTGQRYGLRFLCDSRALAFG